MLGFVFAGMWLKGARNGQCIITTPSEDEIEVTYEENKIVTLPLLRRS